MVFVRKRSACFIVVFDYRDVISRKMIRSKSRWSRLKAHVHQRALRALLFSNSSSILFALLSVCAKFNAVCNVFRVNIGL